MDRNHLLTALLSLALCAGPGGVRGDEAPAGGTPEEADTKAAPAEQAGQEVEVNEDNYRQFMELRDRRLQREVLPETAFRPQSGLHKLDKLPEASQKHLRDQLREVIVRGDAWEPGDELEEYPYVPSEAARTDPSLRSLEAEAWGELVSSYHDREAEIYANSARTRAAAANQGGADGGEGAESASGSSGRSAAAQQPGQRGASPGADTPGRGPAGSEDSESTAGVSQNALEYLRGGRSGSAEGVAPAPAAEEPPEGTLTVEDLANAEGVRAALGAGTADDPAGDPGGSDDKAPGDDAD